MIRPTTGAHCMAGEHDQCGSVFCCCPCHYATEDDLEPGDDLDPEERRAAMRDRDNRI